jgi:dienelactone hydrolase
MADPQSARLAVRDLLALEAPERYAPTSVERQDLGERAGVMWERIEVRGADGDVLPCLLLTPDRPVARTVIAVHQHNGEFAMGKSEPAGLVGDASLAYGLRLAERGARVLLPDLVGFEDRARGWSSEPAADERLDAFLRVANGDSLQSKHTRDIATLTTWIVDSHGADSGVGIIGHSLGGQVALFSLAVDPRLTVGVVSCGVGTVRSFQDHRISHNPAWFVPALVAAGDVPVLASALQDQHVLVSAGLQDPLFPAEGVRAVLAGFRPGVCSAELFSGGHELPPAVLESALAHLTAVAR